MDDRKRERLGSRNHEDRKSGLQLVHHRTLINALCLKGRLLMAVRRAFEWLQNLPSRDGRKPIVRPYDYGFVGEMSVLMNAHPLIGPALAELFMRVMFAPGALARPEREMIAAIAAAAQDCHY